MLSPRVFPFICSLLALWMSSACIAAASEPRSGAPGLETWASSGVIVLNQNDTALPDHFMNVPITVAATYHINPIFAVEGECSWLLPVQREIDLDAGYSADRKTPDAFTCQANIIAKLPLEQSSWSPHLTAGCGTLTFLSDTDEDRLPQLKDAQTMVAMNFGVGVSYQLTQDWVVRVDFREFAAFPSDDTEGLSTDGSADPIWMERISAGLGYRF